MNKQLTPNHDMLKQSAVYSLKNAYAEYNKAVQKYMRLSGFNSEGTFFEYEGLSADVEKKKSEIIRLLFQLDEIKAEIRGSK